MTYFKLKELSIHRSNVARVIASLLISVATYKVILMGYTRDSDALFVDARVIKVAKEFDRAQLTRVFGSVSQLGITTYKTSLPKDKKPVPIPIAS